MTRELIADMRASSFLLLLAKLLLICSIRREVVVVSRSKVFAPGTVVCDDVVREGLKLCPGRVISEPKSLLYEDTSDAVRRKSSATELG